MAGAAMVGPALAKRIIACRERYGGFAFPEELTEVEGVSWARLEGLRPYVAVEPGQNKTPSPSMP